MPTPACSGLKTTRGSVLDCSPETMFSGTDPMIFPSPWIFLTSDSYLYYWMDKNLLQRLGPEKGLEQAFFPLNSTLVSPLLVVEMAVLWDSVSVMGLFVLQGVFYLRGNSIPRNTRNYWISNSAMSLHPLALLNRTLQKIITNTISLVFKGSQWPKASFTEVLI